MIKTVCELSPIIGKQGEPLDERHSKDRKDTEPSFFLSAQIVDHETLVRGKMKCRKLSD